MDTCLIEREILMENTHINPASLEEVLVKQFRAFQDLKSLTQEERKALFDHNTEALLPILETKEKVMEDVQRLESNLTDQIHFWIHEFSLNQENANLSMIIPYLGKEWQQKIIRLQQGIFALVEEIREMNGGNMALVRSAIERSEATREFLISLYQVSMESYGPTEQARPENFTFSELDTQV